MKWRGVALMGNKGVGKTTLARFLEDRFLLKRVHPKNLFAEMVSPVMLRMGVPVDELPARLFGSRIDEPLLPPWEALSGRRLLQAAGGGFLDDLGVEGLAHLLTTPPRGAIALIESVRRVAEAEWLRREGWFLLRVTRPGREPTGEHATEVDLSGVEVDYEVANDRSEEEMLVHGSNAVQHRVGVPVVTRAHPLLVVNGRPGCGKDTLTEMLGDRCREYDVPFAFASSIQPVKRMLSDAGVDTGRKTARDRDLLAEVKAALVRHDQWPNRWVARQALAHGNRDRRTLFVTHVREHSEIYELCQMAPGVVTMWMYRPGVPESGAQNAGDQALASQFDYALTVGNKGTVADLEARSGDVLRAVFGARV